MQRHDLLSQANESQLVIEVYEHVGCRQSVCGRTGQTQIEVVEYRCNSRLSR
ncbi:MAG TPA: hypothetical protein VNY31_04960 [Solirubrobacteraceae bacterium]|nr:hypothetical protein [Solirubrobacteraceae bacterium]